MIYQMDPNSSKVILLDFWPSSYGIRVRLALALKGVAYEHREEDFSNKSLLLLESNPVHKTIHVLIHNGRAVCGSPNIVEYVDEVWRDTFPLLPDDPYERARCRFWADFIDKKVYQCGPRMWKVEGEEQRCLKEEFISYLKQLQMELGERCFFGGERMGIVDVALLPYSCWFYTFETMTGFSVEEEAPKLVEWATRCKEVEGVKKVLPHPSKVHEFACQWKERMLK